MANTAQSNVSSTVDVVGGKVCFWDVAFADKVDNDIKTRFHS